MCLCGVGWGGGGDRDRDLVWLTLHALLCLLQVSSPCFVLKSTKHCQRIRNNYFCIFMLSFVFSNSSLQPLSMIVVGHIAHWLRRAHRIFLWSPGKFWAFLLAVHQLLDVGSHLFVSVFKAHLGNSSRARDLCMHCIAVSLCRADGSAFPLDFRTQTSVAFVDCHF